MNEVIMGGIFRKELSNALSCQRFLIVVDINVQFSESIFATTNNNNQSLVNLHMQLRKCVAHPYLFRGS